MVNNEIGKIFTEISSTPRREEQRGAIKDLMRHHILKSIKDKNTDLLIQDANIYFLEKQKEFANQFIHDLSKYKMEMNCLKKDLSEQEDTIDSLTDRIDVKKEKIRMLESIKETLQELTNGIQTKQDGNGSKYNDLDKKSDKMEKKQEKIQKISITSGGEDLGTLETEIRALEQVIAKQDSFNDQIKTSLQANQDNQIIFGLDSLKEKLNIVREYNEYYKTKENIKPKKRTKISLSLKNLENDFSSLNHQKEIIKLKEQDPEIVEMKREAENLREEIERLSSTYDEKKYIIEERDDFVNKYILEVDIDSVGEYKKVEKTEKEVTKDNVDDAMEKSDRHMNSLNNHKNDCDTLLQVIESLDKKKQEMIDINDISSIKQEISDVAKTYIVYKDLSVTYAGLYLHLQERLYDYDLREIEDRTGQRDFQRDKSTLERKLNDKLEQICSQVSKDLEQANNEHDAKISERASLTEAVDIPQSREEQGKNVKSTEQDLVWSGRQLNSTDNTTTDFRNENKALENLDKVLEQEITEEKQLASSLEKAREERQSIQNEHAKVTKMVKNLLSLTENLRELYVRDKQFTADELAAAEENLQQSRQEIQQAKTDLMNKRIVLSEEIINGTKKSNLTEAKEEAIKRQIESGTKEIAADSFIEYTLTKENN